MQSRWRAWASRSSAVSAGAPIAPSRSSSSPCRSAVSTLIAGSVGLFLQLLGVIEIGAGGDQLVQAAFHHLVELIQRQADAVVGDPVFLEVISADLLTAVAGADLAAAVRADGLGLFLHLQLIEPRAQHALALGAILDLRLFVLATDHQTGR